MDHDQIIEKSSPSVVKLLLWLTVIVHLMANIFGSPIVKFTYLVFVLLLTFQITTRKPKDVIFPFIIFSLFEGQGRVVWGYSAWARIIFDILMVYIILKDGIKKRKLWNWDILPTTLNVLFILHFLWFFIELFNPIGAGFLASFATSKFYIFPILLFFFFMDIPLKSSETFLQKNIIGYMLVIILSAIIVMVQDSGKELFMEQISGNYVNLFAKYKVFQDYAFRPWGTSFLPGGMGTLFFCSVGFILLFNSKVISQKPVGRIGLSLLKYLCLSFMFYCLFIGEVRSALIKFVGIIGFTEVWNFLKGEKKFKKIVGLISIVTIGFITLNSVSDSDLLKSLDYENEVARWTELKEEGVASQRSGFWKLTDAVYEKVKFPLGFGLGMTTYFLPAFEAKRRSLVDTPIYDYWNMDNLFMFLLLELGIGAIFYGGAIIFIFVASVSQLFYAYKHFDKNDFRDVSVAVSSIIFILIGNWGAVGLPYNPESFYFWFWVALLFKTVNRVKYSSSKQVVELEEELP